MVLVRGVLFFLRKTVTSLPETDLSFFSHL
jgi:hypothetical protein